MTRVELSKRATDRIGIQVLYVSVLWPHPAGVTHLHQRWGANEAEISFQISALAGVRPRSLMAANVTTRLRHYRGSCAVMWRPSRATPVCCLAPMRATYTPYKPPLDGPFRRVKTYQSQMGKPKSPVKKF